MFNFDLTGSSKTANLHNNDSLKKLNLKSVWPPLQNYRIGFGAEIFKVDRHRFQSVKKWLTAVNHAKNQNDTSKHSKVRHFSRNFKILKNKQIIFIIFSRLNSNYIYDKKSLKPSKTHKFLYFETKFSRKNLY